MEGRCDLAAIAQKRCVRVELQDLGLDVRGVRRGEITRIRSGYPHIRALYWI